jgi:subtilisin family serine protease
MIDRNRQIIYTITIMLIIWLVGSELYEQRKERNKRLKPPAPMIPLADGKQRPTTMRAVRNPGGISLRPGPNLAEAARIGGDVTLRFADETDLVAFLKNRQRPGVTIVDVAHGLNALRVRFTDEDAFQDLLQQGPPPELQEDNYRVSIPPPPNPDATGGGNYLGFGSRALRWLGLREDNSTWGKDIVVAVLDTGVDASHSTFGEDAIKAISVLDDEQTTGAGHATAVASIIAGADSAAPGVAPAASVLSVRVLGDDGLGNTFDVAAGIVEAVDRGADIINLSLGTYGNSGLLKEAVDYAQAKGVVIVAATGNDGASSPMYPARYDGVIAVGAVDAAGQHLDFSNTGEEVGIAAPGYNVLAAWEEDGVIGFSGTSAAVPFVSGTLAAMMSQESGMTGAEAAQILRDYSDDAGAPGADEQFGDGVLNIGRLQERAEDGIVDLALVSHTVTITETTPEDAVDIVIAAQNRGTSVLESVELEVLVNNEAKIFHFKDVGVGETITDSVTVFDAMLEEGNVTLHSTVNPVGAEDRNTRNNSKESVLQSNDDEQTE